MDTASVFHRFQLMRTQVRWAADDGQRLRQARDQLSSAFPGLIDAFYDQLLGHFATRRFLLSGRVSIDVLKGRFGEWLNDLFQCNHDEDYVARRWRAGWRHVEIGLNEFHVHAAMSDLRSRLIRLLHDTWPAGDDSLIATIDSLNRALDLDLALIDDAYQYEYRNRLQTSERMATLGQLASAIAAELRGPLARIRGAIEANQASAQGSPSPDRQAILRHLAAAELVAASLNTYAHLPLPRTERLDLAPLIDKVIQRASLPGTIVVAKELDASLAPVLADADQIQAVLDHLMRNAQDAMPAGGHITIRGQTSGEFVEITVEDTGEGISPELLPRIFEPLFTTRSHGLGLGLPLARSLVTRNRGSLEVASQPGAGSRFVIRLPLASRATPPH